MPRLSLATVNQALLLEYCGGGELILSLAPSNL